jgi:FkbM family methyltransferase
MRRELLWNPRLLCERLGAFSIERRRRQRLRHTVARGLSTGHLDSLELLDLVDGGNVTTIYDIGANIGTWTQLAKAVLPRAAVEAFEPLPQHCDAFVARCGDLPAATLHRIALGAENGSATMRVTSSSDASSMLPLARAGRDHFRLAEVEQTTVGMRRLDDYVMDANLPMPDLIKLDVQGFELQVIEGAASTIDHAQALIVEVAFVEVYAGQCSFADVCSTLAAKGFGVHAFSASTPLGRPLVQADVLFRRTDRS